MSKRVFISYRRDDTQYQTDILYNEMIELGVRKEDIFKDIESIALGVNFDDAIDTALANSDIVLVVIGNNWFSEKNKARLQNPNDFVRREIAKALAIDGKIVVPVLFDAEMPNADDLPDDLKPIWRRNAIEISRKYLDQDVTDLVNKLGLAEGKINQTANLSHTSHANHTANASVESYTQDDFDSIGKTEKTAKVKKSVTYILAGLGILFIIFVLGPCMFGKTESTDNATYSEANPIVESSSESNGEEWTYPINMTDEQGEIAFPFVDIVNVSVAKTPTRIAFGIHLTDIQQPVTYNHTNLPDNSWEYEYSAGLDFDKDGNNDYLVHVGFLKSGGYAETSDYIKNFCAASVWKYTNGSGNKENITVNWYIQESNWLWMEIPITGDFAYVDENTAVVFYTSHNDGTGTYSDTVKK